MRILAILAAVICVGCAQQQEAVSDAKHVVPPNDKAAIVAASIYGYEVNLGKKCPCPYSQGGACKGKSAYERKGGIKPRCYQTDVAKDDLTRWQQLVNEAPEGPQPTEPEKKKQLVKAATPEPEKKKPQAN